MRDVPCWLAPLAIQHARPSTRGVPVTNAGTNQLRRCLYIPPREPIVLGDTPPLKRNRNAEQHLRRRKQTKEVDASVARGPSAVCVQGVEALARAPPFTRLSRSKIQLLDENSCEFPFKLRAPCAPPALQPNGCLRQGYRIAILISYVLLVLISIWFIGHLGIICFVRVRIFQ